MSIPVNCVASIVLVLLAGALTACQVAPARSSDARNAYEYEDCVTADTTRDCYVAFFADESAVAQRDPRGFPQHYLELWDDALRHSDCGNECAALDSLSGNYFNPDGRPSREELGVALEGGGNKSGPFTLGVLAGLQEMDLLQTKVTAISSVSGGSYAASFYYNRLFDLHPPFAQVTRTQVDQATDEWFRSCIPDYFGSKGKRALLAIRSNTAGFPGCGEVDGSGAFRPFDARYAYQEQVWLHHDVLRLVNSADDRTNESLQYRQFANLAALAVATAATVPFQFIARSVFRWPVNSAPSKAAYKLGLERQYGYSPSDWAAAMRDSEATPIWWQSTQRRRKRTLANLAVNVPPDHMPQWIIATTAPGYIGGTQWLGAMPRDPIRQQFEITPLGFGSGTYGYAMAFPDAPFDITGPNPEGLPILDAVVASAAFFDDNQLLITKQPLRFFAAAGQQFLNVDWFSEIRNFRTDDGSRRQQWLEPWPVYLRETQRGPATPYIHLQDGGNAENSGILPLLRRGYRTIVYAHGTTDEDAGFAAICHLKNQLEYDGKYYVVSEDLERLVGSLTPTFDEVPAAAVTAGQPRFRSYLDQLCTLQIDRSDIVAFDANERRAPEARAQPVAKLFCGRLGQYTQTHGYSRTDPDPGYDPCPVFKERFPTKHADTPPCSNCAHPSIPTTYTVSTHLFYRSSVSPLRFHVCRGDVLDRNASAPNPKPPDWEAPLSTIVAVVPALPVSDIAAQLRSTPPWTVDPKDPWASFCALPVQAREQMSIAACAGPDGRVLSAAGVPDAVQLAEKGMPCTALAHLLEDKCHRETRAASDIVHPKFPQNDLVLATLHSTYPAYAAYFDLGRHQVRRALLDSAYPAMAGDDDPQRCSLP